jgi:hypothetical protein
MPLSVLKCPPLHIGRDGDIELLQNRWGHSQKVYPVQFNIGNSRKYFMLNSSPELCKPCYSNQADFRL